MAVTVGELNAKLGLDSSSFTSGLGVAAAGLAGIGAALVGVAAKGISEFVQLEEKMAEVFTLMPGITQSAMDDMTGQVRDFAVEFGVLPENVVPALYDSISAGVPADNVFEFLEVAQRAARGGVTDLSIAVDGLTSVVNAYGSENITASEASDQMFTAVRLGKTTMEELSQSLFNVLPTAAATGVQFGNITAAMATLTAQGVPTSVATTQMRQLLVELSKDGSKASDAFKEVAGVGMQEFIDQGGDLADVLSVMEDAAADNGVSLADMFGSVEAGAAALALTGSNAEGFRDNLDAMSDAAGATDAAFETMENTTAARMEKVQARINEAFLKVGEVALPLLEGLLNLFDAVIPVIERVIETLAAFFTSSGEGTQQVSTFFEDMRDTVEPVLTTIGEAVESFVDLAMALWELLGDEILAIWNALWPVIVSTVETFFAILGGIFDAFTSLITGDWEGFKEAISGIWDALWQHLETVLSAAVDILIAIIEGLKDIWDGIFESMRDAVSEAWQAVSDWFGDLGQSILDAIGNLDNLLWDIGKNIVQGFIDGVSSKFADVRAKFTSLTNLLPDWKGPESVDLQLLAPSGRMVLEGFMRGIDSKVPELRSQLQGITADLTPGGVFAAPSSRRETFGAGSTTVIVELDSRVLARAVTTRQHDETRLRLGRRFN